MGIHSLSARQRVLWAQPDPRRRRRHPARIDQRLCHPCQRWRLCAPHGHALRPRWTGQRPSTSRRTRRGGSVSPGGKERFFRVHPEPARLGPTGHRRQSRHLAGCRVPGDRYSERQRGAHAGVRPGQPAHAQPAGCGKDGHHQRLARQLDARLYPLPGSRRLGRQQRRPSDAEHHRSNRRGADLARFHGGGIGRPGLAGRPECAIGPGGLAIHTATRRGKGVRLSAFGGLQSRGRVLHASMALGCRRSGAAL